MSLINDALKKAQKLREADEAAKRGKVPAPGAETPVAPPTPPPPPPPAAPPAATPEPDSEPEPIAAPSVAYTVPASASVRTKRTDSGELGKVLKGAGAGVVVSALGWWFLASNDGAKKPDDAAASVAAVEPVESAAEPQAAAATVAPPQAARPSLDPTAGEVPAATSVIETRASTTEPTAPGPTVQFVLQEDIAPAPVVLEVPQPLPAARGTGNISQQATTIPTTAPTTGRVASATPTAAVAVAEKPEPATVNPALATAPAAKPSQPVAPEPAATTQPVATPVVASPLPVASRNRPTSAPSGQVQIMQDNAPSQPQPQAVAQLDADPAVLTYLETARVTGVRASATDPKVLMNSRVYRLNDVVDRTLQLRVTKIESRGLEFSDSRGFVYTKLF